MVRGQVNQKIFSPTLRTNHEHVAMAGGEGAIRFQTQCLPEHKPGVYCSCSQAEQWKLGDTCCIILSISYLNAQQESDIFFFSIFFWGDELFLRKLSVY